MGLDLRTDRLPCTLPQKNEESQSCDDHHHWDEPSA